MKAISLHQPYASAIALDLKHYETRSWAPPKSVIGQRIAIHAAKHWNCAAMREIYECCLDGLFRKKGVPALEYLPFGAVVCTAELGSVHRITRAFVDTLPDEPNYEILWGDYTDGRFAWELKNVQPLTKPFTCLGRQGFFNVDLPAPSSISNQQSTLSNS